MTSVLLLRRRLLLLLLLLLLPAMHRAVTFLALPAA
jgi:hypothetical protein